jgi:hypothetical protein
MSDRSVNINRLVIVHTLQSCDHPKVKYLTPYTFMKKTIFNLQSTHQILRGLGIVLVLSPLLSLTAQAQTSFEGAIDRAFSTESFPGANEQQKQFIVSMKKWIGPYQKARVGNKKGNYIAVFNRGYLPIQISGLLQVGVGCPVTKLPLSTAPSNIKAAFLKCPNLKA